MQYARYMDSRLKNSNPTAHAANRLVLLGSPPDTVHGATLRRTGLSSLLIQVRRHITRPGVGIHSRCSGLRAEGTANSPTSAALLRSEAEHGKMYFTILFAFSQQQFSQNKHFCKFFRFSSKNRFSPVKNPLYKNRKGGYNSKATREYGPVAQLGERSVRIREVEGSSPFGSTSRGA